MSLTDLTLTQISQKLIDRSLTSREITEAYLAKIEQANSVLNAYLSICPDTARKMADQSDSRIQNDQALSPLDGVPIALKDVVSTVELPTTAASKILEDYQSPFDATVWTKLKEAGCVLLGKTNTDEFTMGGSTENSAFGVTRNPYSENHVAGGSSGGSAAAVGADLCAAALGTQTGGAIRQPASFCGITGLKVSYGRVSRWGTIPMASSLDTIGPMGKTAEDCALLLQIIAGQDALDSTTPDIKVPEYKDYLNDRLKGMKIGIPKEYFIDGISSDIEASLNATKQILKDLGAELVDVSLPHTKYAVPAYYIIAPSEISANMSRYDGIRFGKMSPEDSLEGIYTETREKYIGEEVKRRILIGTYALSAGYYDAFYRKAQKVRTLIKQDFDNVFQEVDALLTPVSPTPAFEIGKNTSDPLQMYLEDIFTIPASLAGICGVSTPAGMSRDGLPIGVQILCPAFAEERALQIAHQIAKSKEE